MAVYAARLHADHVLLCAAIPLIFLAGQIVRAVLRQLIAGQDAQRSIVPQLLPAALADILGCWLWSIVLFLSLLSSAFGRTIRWRGIRYRLVSPTQIQILEKGDILLFHPVPGGFRAGEMNVRKVECPLFLIYSESWVGGHG